MATSARGMEFYGTAPIYSAKVLAPQVLRFGADLCAGSRVLDVGCGSGYWAAQFAARGCTAVGVDPSESGIRHAREGHPGIRFEQMEITEHALSDLGEEPFDAVISTEVVEHLYDPPVWAAGCFKALKPGGKLIGSTPYHGRIKDVALALGGKMEFHHDALRVGGHIKFFTNRTLRQLLADASFSNVEMVGVGRAPYLWWSTVFCAVR
jgi:2-polyprenyl-3-methyl-5-hydroxy-6-metoxy-1,4-benzoquinol methylase